MPLNKETKPKLLTNIASMFWSTASKSLLLDLHDLFSSSRFLQHEQNFLSLLVIALQSTAPSPSAQQMLSSASVAQKFLN